MLHSHRVSQTTDKYSLDTVTNRDLFCVGTCGRFISITLVYVVLCSVVVVETWGRSVVSPVWWTAADPQRWSQLAGGGDRVIWLTEQVARVQISTTEHSEKTQDIAKIEWSSSSVPLLFVLGMREVKLNSCRGTEDGLLFVSLINYTHLNPLIEFAGSGNNLES